MPNRLLYRCLVFSLAGLLLLLHTGVGTAMRSGQNAAQTATKQKGNPTDQQAGAVVKATLDDALVSSALSFDFSQVTYLLFTADTRLLTLNRPLLRRVFDAPQFFSSYLRQVLGHFIAPNAP